MRARHYCVDCGTMHLRTLGGGREGDPCRNCGGRCDRTKRLGGSQPINDGRNYVVQIKVTEHVRKYLAARGPNYSRAASDALEEIVAP